MLLDGIVLAGGMLMVGGWWLVVGVDPYDCAYAVHMPDTMPPSNQRLKVLLITA